ncbi:MAG: hypothetical protein HYR77_08650 [Ignavibacteria bacterium]|nr:hypothetical protein [Ignavibacteria bacterium]
MIDSIFSVVIGGIIVLLLHGVMANLRSFAINQTMNTTTQTNMVAISDIVENDFRKAGYGTAKSPSDSGVVYARADSLVLRGDFDNNGTLDVIRYYITKVKPSSNVNPRTRMLYRVFNGVTQPINLGMTSLQFTFYDGAGVQLLASPSVSRSSQIRSIRLVATIESTRPSEITRHDTTYAYGKWEEVVRPRNLR